MAMRVSANLILVVLLFFGTLLIPAPVQGQSPSPFSPPSFHPPVVPAPPPYKPIPPQRPPQAGPLDPNAPYTAQREQGVLNPRTGEFYPGSYGGVIDPRTGVLFPRVNGGYVNPQTGEVIPRRE